MDKIAVGLTIIELCTSRYIGDRWPDLKVASLVLDLTVVVTLSLFLIFCK